MISKLITLILITLSFTILAVFGILTARFSSLFFSYIFAGLGILWLLTVSGLVGPKSLKKRMREFFTYFGTKTKLFFPLDPYQPIDEILKSGAKEFWPTKERAKNFLFWSIIGKIIIPIVFFGILIGGILAWQYFGASEEETANWKTYRNEKYSIEFQYPNSWILDDKEALSINLPDQTKNFIQINVSNDVSGPEDESMSPCQPGIASVVYQVGKLRDSQQTFEEFVNFQIENPERGMPPAVKPRLIQATIGGHNALKIEKMVDNCKTEFFYVEQNLDHYMTISFIVDKNDDKLIIDQMLSTFKFLGEGCTTEGNIKCNVTGCIPCCSGLESRYVKEPMRNKTNEVVCVEEMTVTKCVKAGNGICGAGENWCISPEDCEKPNPRELEPAF